MRHYIRNRCSCLGDIYTLAVSNTNATLQSNKSVFHNKGVRFPCFCFLVNHYFDLLVVGDVSSHPGVTVKCNVTLETWECLTCRHVMFPSAVCRNFDANQGKLIRITAV